MGDLSQMSSRACVNVKVILPPPSLYFIFARSHAPEATNATNAVGYGDRRLGRPTT
jgi:hypothetical protein